MMFFQNKVKLVSFDMGVLMKSMVLILLITTA